MHIVARVEPTEEDFGNGGYVWVNQGNKISSGSWKELRKNDTVKIIFPYLVVNLAIGGLSYYSKLLLKLNSNAHYCVRITVKGEDPDRNTIIREKTKKSKLSNSKVLQWP